MFKSSIGRTGWAMQPSFLIEEHGGQCAKVLQEGHILQCVKQYMKDRLDDADKYCRKDMEDNVQQEGNVGQHGQIYKKAMEDNV